MFSIIRQNFYKTFLKFYIHKIIYPNPYIISKYLCNKIKTSPNGIFISLNFQIFHNLLSRSRNSELPLTKLKSYWGQKTDDLLVTADNLFSEERYLEVYELLNRIKYINNVDIQWRICRVLFTMSIIEKMPRKIRDKMISEAYDLIHNCMEIDSKNPEVHKWMAIILDAKSGLEGAVFRIKAAPQVKEHMLKCLEYNPRDAGILYMLGHWCFEMTSLTWMQRSIASVLFFEPPEASYQEAYRYFMKVEDMYPRMYSSNTFMLGKCCYELGMYYRARYYLELVKDMPVMNEYQRMQAEEANFLAELLDKYDVATLALHQST